MNEMIFKNRDELSLLDQFKLHTKQREIDQVLRRSYSIVQEHLKTFLEATEEDIEALVSLPPSDRYQISMTSERDQTSFKFRWFITLKVEGHPQNSYDHLFEDREKQARNSSFRIIISPKHIGFELDNSGTRHMYRLADIKLEDHKISQSDINEEARVIAIEKVHDALAHWIAKSCPDHAAIYFLQREGMFSHLERATAPEQTAPHNNGKNYTAPQSFTNEPEHDIEFNPLLMGKEFKPKVSPDKIMHLPIMEMPRILLPGMKDELPEVDKTAPKALSKDNKTANDWPRKKPYPF